MTGDRAFVVRSEVSNRLHGSHRIFTNITSKETKTLRGLKAEV